MAYRNLTQEQFRVIKDAAKKVCLVNGMETIGDFKVIGNELIDEIESKNLTFGDLLQDIIPYKPRVVKMNR